MEVPQMRSKYKNTALMLIIVDGFIRWPQTPTLKIDQSRNVTGTLHKFSDTLHHTLHSPS